MEGWVRGRGKRRADGGEFWVRFAPARGLGALWRDLARDVRQHGSWLRFAELNVRVAGVLKWAREIVETVHFVAFSCITILGMGAGSGFWARRVEAGMAASPFHRRAVGARRRRYPNMLRTDLEEEFWEF